MFQTPWSETHGGSRKIWGPEMAFGSGLCFLALVGQKGTFPGSCVSSEVGPCHTVPEGLNSTGALSPEPCPWEGDRRGPVPGRAVEPRAAEGLCPEGAALSASHQGWAPDLIFRNNLKNVSIVRTDKRCCRPL